MGFGDFEEICAKTPLPLCPLVGTVSQISGTHSTYPDCYARSIELANTIIFEGATGFAHILALIMLVIMILHVRSKFTAVGMSDFSYGTRRAGKGLKTRRQWDRDNNVLMHEQVGRRSPHSSTHTHSSQCARWSSIVAWYLPRAARTLTSSRCNAVWSLRLALP